MDKREAIEKLKEELDKIPTLREEHYDNQDFKLWLHKVETIIKAALDPDDLKTFSSARPSSFPMRGVATENSFKEHYQEELTSYDTALKSILQKYETLGFETEPAAEAEPSKDSVESPIYLFDKMQFHPRVIAASKSLFRDGHYASAILEAYKAVNNFVKEKTGLSLDGKALMSEVFSESTPIIKLNELLTQSDRDEQEGFKFLFMGAMVGIRNPKAHDNVVQTDPYRTLEYLSFASLLMKRIEEGKVVRLQKRV